MTFLDTFGHKGVPNSVDIENAYPGGLLIKLEGRIKHFILKVVRSTKDYKLDPLKPEKYNFGGEKYLVQITHLFEWPRKYTCQKVTKNEYTYSSEGQINFGQALLYIDHSFISLKFSQNIFSALKIKKILNFYLKQQKCS